MVRIWRVADGVPVSGFASPDGWVRAVGADERGRRVAVGSRPGDIRVRDLDEERLVAHLQGHTRILMLGFTSGTGGTVSSAADGTVRSWSLPGQE
jgi:WD40 repeat protein